MNLSMLSTESMLDPSDRGGSVLKVSSRRPIELIDFVDLVNNLRQTHAGIITLARGSVREGALGELEVRKSGLDKNLASAGWHMHERFYALNLSKGSELPTLFTRPGEASRAILASIDAHRQAISEVEPTQAFPFAYMDSQERTIPVAPRSLLGHILDVREKLTTDGGGSNVALKLGTC